MITEDISNALKIEKNDFDRLIMTFFFYANKLQIKQSLEKAYEVLESNASDDNATLKKIIEI